MATKSKPKAAPKKAAKGSKKPKSSDPAPDSGIVIVDDNLSIDQDKVNEERRAYLEEARSQEASD